jgi:hypothetical protein
MVNPNDLVIELASTSGDYIYLKIPNHPYADKKGYILEHRFVMEKYLGRFLLSKEIVHHIDEIKTNNVISNLEIHTSSSHAKHHNPKKRLVLECIVCGIVFERIPSQIKRKGKKHSFCSISCSSKFYNPPVNVPHGTDNAYTYHGCRCVLCKDAHTRTARRRRTG